MTTEIEKVQGALVRFDEIEAGLAALRDKYTDVVYQVATKDGMRDALAARADIRKPRYSAEEIRKAAKAPILELGRTLDAKAKYIQAELLKIEEPIQAQIALEEERKEREIRAENIRVTEINQSITDLHMIVSSMAGKPAAAIAKRIADIQEYDLTEWAGEFIAQAEKARAGAVAGLEQLLAGALAQEQAAAAEAKRIADEKADFERRQRELADRERAEAARLAQERAQRDAGDKVRREAEHAARAKIEEAERASRAKIEAEERAARLAQQARDEVERQKRATEEAHLKAERDEIDRKARLLAEAQRREQEAIEAAAKAKRDAEYEVERQKRIRENEIKDGWAQLSGFVRMYGHLSEFKVIADLIDDFLTESKDRKAA